MFVVIIVLILWACASIVWSFYFNTIAFQKAYWNVSSYYWAYYWAISSIERWLLMTKIKYPTYSWSWWFKWTTVIGSNSNLFSWEFWRLNRWNNSLMWYIDSETENISSSIDTQTLRVISFYKYTDEGPGNYTNSWITKSHYWVSEWLSFSWTVNPKTWWRITDDNKIKENNVDFNRLFEMEKPNYTVRSLWYDYKLDNPNWEHRGQDKDSPLSGQLIFTWCKGNPRPALSWDFISWAVNWC